MTRFHVAETPWSNIHLRPDAPDSFGVYDLETDEGTGPLCVAVARTRADALTVATQLNEREL